MTTTNPDDGAHTANARCSSHDARLPELPELPELSDLIVDFDRGTLERRDVMRHAVLDALSPRAAWMTRRVLAGLAGPTGMLDRESVDAVLVRSHLELQRLHEEFHVGAMMCDLITPMVALARELTLVRPLVIVSGLAFADMIMSASRA